MRRTRKGSLGRMPAALVMTLTYTCIEGQGRTYVGRKLDFWKV